ncbi:Uncharacterised protein [Burkholderia pseudomallei]|nr:Uncharacterised protein [Burkholderia pseudomallei]
MTTDNSRADALTDAQIIDLIYECDIPPYCELAAIDFARRLLLAVSQPAAAPIPEDCDVRNILLDVVPGEDGEGQEVYARNVADVERLLSEMGEKLDAAKQPAPAPADERAAFVERVMGMFEAWPNGKPGPTDEPESHYRFGYNTALEDVLTALDVGSPTRRAASANETGAEEADEPYDEGDIERHFDDHGFYLHGFEEEDRANFFEAALALVAGRSPAMAAEAVAFGITEQAAAEWASRHDVNHVLNHFSTQRNAIEDARTLHLLGASPSSQPAAAPIDEVTCARMGHGVVSIGECFSPELQEPGIIFMKLPEQRDIGLDTGDVFPAGSRAPSDKMLAYISFANPNAIDQTISVLQRIKAKHFPAPSPAGEGAALPEDRIDWIANTHCPGGMAYPANVKNAIREALREARISDNETGAEAAQQLSTEIGEIKAKLVSYEREREDQTRYLAAQSEEIASLKQQLAQAGARVEMTATVIQKCIDSCAAEYLEDVTGHPEDAAYCQGITDCIDALNRLKSADWSVILAAHSGQSEPETATVARIEQLRKALFESRDAMRVMSNWAKKSDPAGHSWAVRMVDRANAALNGEPEPRAEVTDEPSLTNPLTPYGMLVRALRIVSGTTLMDMADALLTTPAKLSAMEFGREPVTPEFAFDVAAYFDAIGVLHTASALRAAAARTGGQ